MNEAQNIRIESYNYELPDDRIPRFPLPQRDQSKLLVYENGLIREDRFFNLTGYLPEGSLLVFNNTRVIQARLVFKKDTGARIEVFCLEPHSPSDYNQNFMQTSGCSWICLVGNAKRWKDGLLKKTVQGMISTPEGEQPVDFEFCAEKLESSGESHLVRFSWNHPGLSFAEILDICGELPIPPYLNRETEEEDKKTYQTVYSKVKGSVAAPTAGLHFTGEVLGELRKKGVSTEELTLHVGAGTFKPVKSELIADHQMHSECFTVKKETIERLIEREGRVVAVGTTSVRSLESLYYLGHILENDPGLTPGVLEVTQWMPYDEQNNRITARNALLNLLQYLNKNGLPELTTHTRIMIAPGYDFKIVNGIITNFHQPQSTLLLLISAFLKGDWKRVYDYALAHDFRFLSYGDSSLLLGERLQTL